MIKDSSDNFVRDTLLPSSKSPRRNLFIKVIGSTVAVGFACFVGVSFFSAKQDLEVAPVALAQATFESAVYQTNLRGEYYTLATEKWPDSNVFEDTAAGFLYAYGGRQSTPQYRWYFTDVPGEPGYQWITNGQWPQSAMYMTKDNYGRTWTGDPGSTGHWLVEVIEQKNDDTDIITLRPAAWLHYYLYVSADATGTLGGWQGDPKNDPQGRFIRTKISDKVIPRLLPGTGPELGWKFLRVVERTSAAESREYTVTFKTGLKLSTSTTAKLDFKAFGADVGLSTTFASESTNEKIEESKFTYGPNFPGKVYWQQTIKYQTDFGEVTYPTENIQSVDGEDRTQKPEDRFLLQPSDF